MSPVPGIFCNSGIVNDSVADLTSEAVQSPRPMSPVRGRVWRAGQEIAADFPLEDLDCWLADPGVLVWVDLCEPEPALLDRLAEELSLNPLSVEDAIEPRERPKVTRHPTHSFITCYSTGMLPDTTDTIPVLQTERMSAFVLPNGLVTVRTSAADDMDEVLERWTDDGLVHLGVAALVYGWLDTVVDGHFRTIQVMDDALEELEDLLFDGDIQPKTIQQRVFAFRKSLVELRRVVLPMREVVAGVMRHRNDRTQRTDRELDTYFEDLYDHVIRAAEWTESLRDMIVSVFETNLSLQEARLNTVMKKLAGWAAIIAVPTAITGWFGQNVPYPGFGTWFGVAFSAALIVIGAVSLYLTFRRFDWI